MYQNLYIIYVNMPAINDVVIATSTSTVNIPVS